MPIYNGNTKVSLSGIKAAYVGNTKVMSSGAWHTVWSGSWSPSVARNTSKWYSNSSQSLTDGRVTSTKFRISYTLSANTSYGNLSGAVGTNSRNLHTISTKPWSGTFTDEVEVYGGAFDPNVQSLSTDTTVLTNTIMYATVSESQWSFLSRMCVFIKPDVSTVRVYGTANNSSAPEFTMTITKIEQFY